MYDDADDDDLAGIKLCIQAFSDYGKTTNVRREREKMAMEKAKEKGPGQESRELANNGNLFAQAFHAAPDVFCMHKI